LNNKILVSIITPAYNAEKYIDNTIKSVIFQDYPYIEHIVIDDGSEDGTINVLKQYEKKYDLHWFSKCNEGQTITVNEGFDLAKGEIVVWLNADDVLFNRQVIRDIVKQFSENPKTDVIYGHMAIIDEMNKFVKMQYAFPWFDNERLLRFHFAACVFYRKKIVQKYKLDTKLNYAMDYEQCFRMYKGGVRFQFINKILMGYRRHKDTKSMSNKYKVNLEVNKIRKKFGQKLTLSHYVSQYLDILFLLAFKVTGITEVIDLNLRPQKYQLAFDYKKDSLIKLIIRQMIPYFT